MPVGVAVKDGLWHVATSTLCAGFVITHGRITWCAPILRKRIDYWRTIAVWVCA